MQEIPDKKFAELVNRVTDLEKQTVFYQVFSSQISKGDAFFKIIGIEKRREMLLEMNKGEYRKNKEKRYKEDF